MTAIRPLPTAVVHLMAAGEVIDSLAAVVRELVENALDAGATRITISLWPESWRVRVADNGAGLSLADLQQAAMAHSTSKIQDQTDLWKITSLGFRGEALHSLAQLARLEICSREISDRQGTQGWRVVYDAQGNPQQTTAIAIATGTIVTVADLFANWPTRRQSLPSSAQQLRAIQLIIQQLALCHPHVTWQVEQHDRPWFTLYPAATAKQTLPQILRDVQSTDLQEFNTVLQASPDATDAAFTSPCSVYLLLGLPDRCHRRRPDWVKVAVNGRCVHLPELEQTILSAFRRTLPRDRHPVCFLHLHLPPDQIDWNRHPAKSEIYLKNLTDWRTLVSQAIAQTLQLSPASLSDQHQRTVQLLKVAEAQSGYNVHRQIQSPPLPVSPDSTLSSPHLPTSPSPDPLTSPSPHILTPYSTNALRAVAQVHNLYILAEHPAGLWLVEQHIAHERVLYEQLSDRWQLVPLTPPIVLSQLSPSQLEQLQRLELEVEPFGEQQWIVRNAPELLAQRSDCPDALMELSLGEDLQAALAATACRSAIRNGTPLSLGEMQTLLDQWQQTRNPHTCPHGRPIYLSLEESALSRFFRRHWVIGKSHGI